MVFISSVLEPDFKICISFWASSRRICQARNLPALSPCSKNLCHVLLIAFSIFWVVIVLYFNCLSWVFVWFLCYVMLDVAAQVVLFPFFRDSTFESYVLFARGVWYDLTSYVVFHWFPDQIRWGQVRVICFAEDLSKIGSSTRLKSQSMKVLPGAFGRLI